MQRYQQTRTALGTDVVLTVLLDDGTDAETLFSDLWREIRIFEATFSRFQPDSELIHVNQRAGTPTPVSPEFIDLARVALRFAERTGELYNPFILPALQTAGYKGSWPHPDDVLPETNFSGRNVVEASQLSITKNAVQIPSNTALDFGGIGKGYLLDSLAQQLGEQSVSNYWLSLGGDILCAGHDVDGRDWQVGVEGAAEPRVLTEVHNSTGESLAIATSGITKRQGTGWHHIIDPHTGVSARTDIFSATVVATKAVEADVFAKCAVIVGSQQAPDFLAKLGVQNYVLQVKTATGGLQLKTTGKVFHDTDITS